VIFPFGTDPKWVRRILLRELSGDECQELYDATGRRIPAMRRALGIRGVIGNKTLARKLYEKGVVLHPKDIANAGLGPSGVRDLESSRYAIFDLGDDFDPEKMMEEAVESDLDPAVFEAMDIRDIPAPANILEWVTGRGFLNTTIFPRQLQIQLAMFEEWCPYCSDRDFVQDIHLSPYIGEDGHRRPWTIDEILERVTMTEYGICPKCKKTYIDFLDDPGAPHCFPKELDACIGQRAGKTRMTEHSMTYNECRFQLLTPSPQQFFGEDITQKFSAVYTALQLSQAQDTLWGAYHLRILAAPWFKTYHAWLDDHGERLGAELYRIKDTYHWYANTGLHSVLRPPFAKEMRGRTGFQGGIDEIGMFAKREGSIRANADEVHKSIGNSLMTLRADADMLVRKGRLQVPTPGLFCISSPWELLDKIMTLVRTADRDPTRVAFHYATWEFNPKIHRNSPQIMAEYANDPVAAERDFGAKPPFAKDPFHPSPDVIDTLHSSGVNMLFVQKRKFVRTRSGKHLVYAIPAQFKPDKTIPRLMCIDAGETDNSFALSIWRLVDLPAPQIDAGADMDDLIDDEDDEDIRVVMEAVQEERARQAAVPDGERKGQVSYLQLDGIIEVQPFDDEQGNHWKVSFKRMWEQCIRPLCMGLNIVGVVSDRWNITQILNGVEELGVYTEQYSLVWSDFLDFKTKTDSRELRLPQPERPFEAVYDDYDKAVRGAPVLHLSVQYRTVRQIGRTVAKPSGGTDDLYRTMVLAHRFAFHEKAVRTIDGKETTFFELLHTSGKAEVVRRAVSVVMLRGGSAGGTSRGVSSGGGFTAVGGCTSRKTGGGGSSYSNVATRGRSPGGQRR